MADFSQNILLVEDNPMDVDLTRRAFNRLNQGITLHIARDGEEAIAYISKWDEGSALPRFILLDLKLPKIDGLDVLREFKSHPKYKMIPVIVLTSSEEDRDLLAAYQSGANSYLVKPIDFDKFNEIAAILFSYWGIMNKTAHLDL